MRRAVVAAAPGTRTRKTTVITFSSGNSKNITLPRTTRTNWKPGRGGTRPRALTARRVSTVPATRTGATWSPTAWKPQARVSSASRREMEMESLCRRQRKTDRELSFTTRASRGEGLVSRVLVPTGRASRTRGATRRHSVFSTNTHRLAAALRCENLNKS